MAEIITYDTQRLEFETLYTGDAIQITTGQDEAAWQYDFDVEQTKHWPEGTIIATSPLGEKSEPMKLALHGCGMWTNRRQNPVQTQERGFTPYFDGLLVGQFILGLPSGDRERIVMDRPGQEISKLNRVPYRENTIQQAVSEQQEPASVKQIMAKIEENLPEYSIESLKYQISEKDVRETLRTLIEQKRIQLLKGKIQRFEPLE